MEIPLKTEAKRPKHHRLTLCSAIDGGYMVVGPTYNITRDADGDETAMFAGSLEQCLDYMGRAFEPGPALLTPDMFKAPAIDAGALLEAMKPGPVTFVPDPVSDLEEVLDDLRLREVKSGVQILDPNCVVAWLGDVQDALIIRGLPVMPMWGHVAQSPPPTIFHESRGHDALAQAAKWLKEEGAKR